MRSTIDKAGRVVIPKALRDEVGLSEGEVEIVADGTAIRIEPVAVEEQDRRSGRPVIRGSGVSISDDIVRSLRFTDQR